ncbi:MAG TPA: HAD family phosphatase [Candidatus Acidoferrales bacterium]|nr:HAD family phosphatase [Candidatus Acidoferrales bacterium]
MHRAIIFDLGKVLIYFDFGIAYRSLESLCPYPAAEIPRRLAASDLVRRLETGLIEPHDFVDKASELLDLHIGYDEFCRVFSCIFTDILIPESMLEALARRYRLILLSNTNALHFPLLQEKYGHLLRHFHRHILSHEVRAMKPDPAIYRAAVEAAGCRPEECFYTDDIALFVEGASNFGIDAVQFQSRAQIERELRARGIVW